MNIIQQLREQAEEIARANLPGWGNTMLLAAEELERMALGQATLARQSAHELGDKLREAQETIRNLSMMIDKDLK